MSQKVRIDGVRHDGASVFLGIDCCGNPCWTRNPERIMVWLCDGWRSRFNQRREQRPRFTPVKDNVTGEVIDWTEEPLGGPNILPLMSDSQARTSCLWMAGIPSAILASTNRIENTEWFAGLKRKKTSGGRVPDSSHGVATWASSAGIRQAKAAITPYSIKPAGSPASWSSQA